jgi:hypothetical protein
MPTFVFMTALQKYRVQAQDREEALRVAFEALNPDENMKAVIESTIYDEEQGKQFEETKS